LEGYHPPRPPTPRTRTDALARDRVLDQARWNRKERARVGEYGTHARDLATETFAEMQRNTSKLL